VSKKTDAQIEREIDEVLGESKKERVTRLMKALRAARSLAFEAESAREYLNPAWDGAEIMTLADEVVRAAEALLSAIANLKSES
jgi:hypothetical protein